MAQPTLKYSIVIPTRNRAKYLFYSLRTVIFPGRDDYEVVVSDNSDAAETLETIAVVKEMNHPCVRYVRPENTPLAMSVHWEFALTQARGEYVTMVGDDDALLPPALDVIDRVLTMTGKKLIQWNRAQYFWPDFVVPAWADFLEIPLLQDAHRSIPTLKSGDVAIRQIARGGMHFERLPMIYNSFVHISLVRQMLGDHRPCLVGQSPDIYSGIVLAALARGYIALGTPLSLVGQGARGNGSLQLNAKKTKAADLANDFQKLNALFKLDMHPQVPDIPLIATTVAESFLKFKDRYPSKAKRVGLRVGAYVCAYCKEIRGLNRTDDEKQTFFDVLERFYQADRKSLALIRHERRLGALPLPAPEIGIGRYSLGIRPAALGITDVCGAAALASSLLAIRPDDFYPASRFAILLKRIARQLTPPFLYNRIAR